MGWNLAVMVPGHGRRFSVMHLDFWPPGAEFIYSARPKNGCLGHFFFFSQRCAISQNLLGKRHKFRGTNTDALFGVNLMVRDTWEICWNLKPNTWFDFSSASLNGHQANLLRDKTLSPFLILWFFFLVNFLFLFITGTGSCDAMF